MPVVNLYVNVKTHAFRLHDAHVYCEIYASCPTWSQQFLSFPISRISSLMQCFFQLICNVSAFLIRGETYGFNQGCLAKKSVGAHPKN